MKSALLMLLLTSSIACGEAPLVSLPSVDEGDGLWQEAWSAAGLTMTEGAAFTTSNPDHVGAFARSVSGAGDVNGDGYDDVVIGTTSPQAAYVFLGGPSGLRVGSEVKLLPPEGAPTAYFGFEVARAGDVNSDGFGDIIVGSPGLDGSTGGAWVYLGSSKGIDVSTATLVQASDKLVSGQFAKSVAPAGDINNDGYDDIVVGSVGQPWYPVGAVYVYFGSAGGIDLGTEVKLMSPTPIERSGYGRGATGAGDVNGDGYHDLIVPADRYGDGAVFVYLGSSKGISDIGGRKITASDAYPSQYFGSSVAGVGDVDGDGYDDVIVGAAGDVSQTGAVYLYRGAPGGVRASTERKITASDGTPPDHFGHAVAAAGDVNNDGYPDVAVGAFGHDGVAENSGAVYIYAGGKTGLDVASEIRLTTSDAAAGDFVGSALSGAGDVNGDGAADIVVGAPGKEWPIGKAYIFRGQCEEKAWYSDADGDGRGDVADVVNACLRPDGYVDNSGDCDDDDPLAWTGATEVCDGVDNDCDGTIDNDDAVDASVWYADEDEDGRGDPGAVQTACARPDGFVDNGDDCDDDEPLAWTGATEECDGADNDCDGTVDNDDAVDASTWYADSDADGYTTRDQSVTGCDPPVGYATESSEPDCDDNDARVYPGADEVPGDAIDQDCDGVDEAAPDGTGGCSTSNHPALWAWMLGLVIFRRRISARVR